MSSTVLRIVLIVLAIIGFLLAAFGVMLGTLHPGWLGLACLAGSGLVTS